MKKIPIIFILFACLACLACTDINSLVDEISNNNMMESEYVGFGTKSKEYQRFQKLKSKASNEELIKLVEHENPIVRTYAYFSLIDRNLIKSSVAFENAMQRNETYSTMSADQLSDSDICTEIYFNIINNYPKSETEIKQIDSLIVFKLDESHFLQYMALNEKEHEETYNNRIVELALEFDNHSAIFYINNNNIEIDKVKFKESIKRVIQNRNIGTKPINRLNNLLEDLEKEN